MNEVGGMPQEDSGTANLLEALKIALLQGIRETGSIAAAGRRLDLSYKQAWYLVHTMNAAVGGPLVTTRRGGKAGHNAQLTPSGNAILDGNQHLG